MGSVWAASDFDQARKAYEQGNQEEAVAGFERALRGAPGGVGVLYNLGNARFRQGELGRALAAWRQAEWITPRDPALRHNLDLIRRRLGQPEVAFPTALPGGAGGVRTAPPAAVNPFDVLSPERNVKKKE
jgi:tetratricopeptide (TPR) repeat protein